LFDRLRKLLDVCTGRKAPKLGRDKAHDVLYAIIHDPAMGDKSLAEMLLRCEDVMADIPEPEIRRMTDATNYLGLSEAMVDRVLTGMNA
jgi:3-carboxy-cis,cis-muconate cycloisomerase